MTMNKGTLAAIAVGIGVIAAGLFALINDFAATEADQQLARWRDRLKIVADSRAMDTSSWLNRHLGVVEQLSRDASLQLYSSLALSGDPETVDAQRSFIFSLLSAVAERQGFHEQRPLDTVAANITRPQRAGLAVVIADGPPVAVTSGMPPLDGPHLPHSDDKTPFIRLGPRLSDGTPLAIFAAPLSAAEGMMDTHASTAWIIGARPLDGAFLDTLVQPGALSRSAETYLVRVDAEGRAQALTPLAGGGRPEAWRTDPAALFAATTPNAIAQQADYAGKQVLVTGRQLSAPVDWTLVRTIAAEEALADARAKRQGLTVTLSLAALAALILLVLAWRHGVSIRLRQAYETQAALKAEAEALSHFLETVSDSQPTAIAVLNADRKITFANEGMARLTQQSVASLKDQTVDGVFPQDAASLLKAGVDSARAGEKAILTVRPDAPPAADGGDGPADSDHRQRVMRARLVPMRTETGHGTSALLVMEDISDLVAARDRSEALLRQMITALTQIIDARDPWSKHHSARVAEVSVAIARELRFNTTMVEATRIAGLLVNLGKIFVPRAILTKQNPLSGDELQLVRASMRKAASLLDGLHFDGPVSAALAQLGARWDGSGEPALKGADIEPVARVLAVANAFVAMVSARAHRAGLGFDTAMEHLQDDAGGRFEKRAVVALANILENKTGRQRWAGFALPPEDDGTIPAS